MTARQETNSASSNSDHDDLRAASTRTKQRKKNRDPYAAMDALSSMNGLHKTMTMSFPQIHSVSMMEGMAAALTASTNMKHFGAMGDLLKALEMSVPKIHSVSMMEGMVSAVKASAEMSVPKTNFDLMTQICRNPAFELMTKQQAQIDAITKSFSAATDVSWPHIVNLRNHSLEAIERSSRQVESMRSAVDAIKFTPKDFGVLNGVAGINTVIDSMLKTRSPFWETIERDRRQFEALTKMNNMTLLTPQHLRLINGTNGVFDLLNPMRKAMEEQTRHYDAMRRRFEVGAHLRHPLIGVDSHLSALTQQMFAFPQTLQMSLSPNFKSIANSGAVEIIIAPEVTHFCAFHAFVGWAIQDLSSYIETAEDIIENGNGAVSGSVRSMVHFVRRRFNHCVERHVSLDDTPVSTICAASPLAAGPINALWQLREELFKLSIAMDQLWSDLIEEQ